jgi:hypothetical protein
LNISEKNLGINNGINYLKKLLQYNLAIRIKNHILLKINKLWL